MRLSSLISYFFAGITFVNGVPHMIQWATGRRNITPFGRDSSPLVNALWGLMNFGGGYLLIRYADGKADTKTKSGGWLIPYEAGALFWSLFGLLYSLFDERRKRSAPLENRRGS